jgi:LEA14-like dessication related protein
MTCRMLRPLLPVLFLLAAGCASLIHEPQVTLKRTNIISLDTAGADLEFYLGITNPNSFDLSLLGYTYDLRVMTLPLAASGLQKTIPIPAGRETDMRLPVRVTFGDLLAILKRRPAPDQIPYQLNARLHIESPLGEQVIPVERTGSFALPEKYRPSFYLNRFKEVINEGH